jgi:hypothetical protein
MKQPRVPEYREADGVQRYLKALTLFLKDFCMEVWTSAKNAKNGVYAFHINEAGHLICTYDTTQPPPLSIDKNGHLIYTIGE